MLVPRIANKASPTPSVPISASSGTSINQSSSSCLVVGISCLSFFSRRRNRGPIHFQPSPEYEWLICKLDRDYFLGTYLALAFSINAISLVSTSRKRVRMAMSKLILARDRRRSRLVPRKNSICTLRRQSAMVSMLCPHLYSPWLEDSTSAKICDVKPVETGERNERLRREKTFFMLATSEEMIT